MTRASAGLLGRRLAALRDDTRGAIVLESIIAFIPLLFFFIGIAQTADGYAAQLVVRRAASAATRAAVVVLPDHGVHYSDRTNRDLDENVGERKRDIESAARMVLSAHGALGTPTVLVSGLQERNQPMTVRVSSDYSCFPSFISIFCGTAKKVRLSAEASLPYQGAPYRYEP